MIVMFRMQKSEKEELLHKVKKMEKFTTEVKEMLEDCLEDAEEYDDDDAQYRDDYDEDETPMRKRRGTRGSRRYSRMK